MLCTKDKKKFGVHLNVEIAHDFRHQYILKYMEHTEIKMATCSFLELAPTYSSSPLKS